MSIDQRVERDKSLVLKPGYAIQVKSDGLSVVPTQDTRQREYNHDVRKVIGDKLAITARRYIGGKSVEVKGTIGLEYVANYCFN